MGLSMSNKLEETDSEDNQMKTVMRQMARAGVQPSVDHVRLALAAAATRLRHVFHTPSTDLQIQPPTPMDFTSARKN